MDIFLLSQSVAEAGLAARDHRHHRGKPERSQCDSGEKKLA